MSNTAIKYNSIGQFIAIKEASSFTNVTFKGNLARYEDNTQYGAKGIEVLSCEAPLIFSQCTFTDNEANSVTPNFYLNRALDV